MSENRLSSRNAAIQEMLTDGEKIQNFYRFVAQNPHISLHDACQIIISRPTAGVCYSFEEWNAMGRRITRGRKGVPYYDADGYKQFVFDANDTHGEERYKRLVYPIKRMLQGLDALNGTEMDSDLRGDYRKIHVGVATYLQENGYFTDDEERNRLILEGVTYSLYSKTGFPKNYGITMHGMTGDLTDNAQLFKDVCGFADFLHKEIEEAYVRKQNEVKVIDDVDEETVSDEPIVSEKADKADEHKIVFSSAVNMFRQNYVILTDYDKVTDQTRIFIGKQENLDTETNEYDNSDDSLIFATNRPQMPYLLYGKSFPRPQQTEQGYEINNYFVQHPEMVLGEMVMEHGMYGALDLTVKPDGRNLADALKQAVSNLPENFYVTPEYDESAEEESAAVDYNVKPLCYKAQNGKLYMRVGESMVEQEIPSRPADAYDRICSMIELRDELRYVLDIQTEGCTDEKLTAEQRTLNAKYDRFVRRYGLVNSQTNTRLFKDDGDSALLFACENLSDDKKTATKADIFSKRTIRPYIAAVSTDDCLEALQICKNERGNVDISYIEEITKKDYDTVLAELGNAVFRNPLEVNPDDKYTGFETAEEYLSGKVVRKLELAEEYAKTYPDSGYEKNVEALKTVQPEPIKASEIAVRLGASWVDAKYYKQFIIELLDLPRRYSDGIQLYYNPHDSSWRIDRALYIRGYSDMNVNKVYGTERADAYRLIADCLNLKATTIFDTIQDSDGEHRVLNKAETIAAREKQNVIKEAFKDWIYRDPERREELERTYNAKFNQIKLPTYDGSYLRFPEMNPAIELKPHQKNAVHRIITGGNTLLHHVVGSGKTFTICAAIMKLRQYGLAKKPMIAVPNHLVQQWASEFRTLYPNAKLLIASKDDLDKENRQKFVSKVAMGDWDAVIIAQSSFAKIPISRERQVAKIREEISRIEETIEAAWDEQGMPRGAVKNLEKIKKNREAQLEKLLDDNKKDNVLIFENLGVDYLFVDEAHYYKNKFLFTKMNNVAGISTAASQRASDLELKCEYINELQGGDKGVVFATGTPISNSMTEMYTMQSYLQQHTLQELGITYFDGWAADFGETVTSLEMTPSGQGYKPKTRFSRFTNLPELLPLYRSFADVQTSDMVKLDVPDVERKVVNLKPSDAVLELADEIAERAERISIDKIPPEIDNMLKVTSDGKKLALDPRCYERSAADEEGSKLNVCADNIAEIWNDTHDMKATQIVFCDLSTPKKAFEDYVYGVDFDVYNDLKYKLVQRGIPPEQIAFIHDANSDLQKQALFDKVNAGTVRVLIGSTEKCGAGTNVQERLIALHHLDTPYRPSDMQQREGRIIRQGNTNKQARHIITESAWYNGRTVRLGSGIVLARNNELPQSFTRNRRRNASGV